MARRRRGTRTAVATCDQRPGYECVCPMGGKAPSTLRHGPHLQPEPTPGRISSRAAVLARRGQALLDLRAIDLDAPLAPDLVARPREIRAAERAVQLQPQFLLHAGDGDERVAALASRMWRLTFSSAVESIRMSVIVAYPDRTARGRTS